MNDEKLGYRLAPFKFWPSQQETEWKKTRPALFGYRDDSSYRASRAWRQLRDRIFAERGGLCQVCEKPVEIGNGATFHHITYEHLCEERDHEMALLCPGCHSKCHIFGISVSGDMLKRLLAVCEATGNDRTDLFSMLDLLLAYAEAHPDLFRKR